MCDLGEVGESATQVEADACFSDLSFKHALIARVAVELSIEAHVVGLLEYILEGDVAYEVLLEILIARPIGVVASYDDLEAVVEQRLRHLIRVRRIGSHIAVGAGLVLVYSKVYVDSFHRVSEHGVELRRQYAVYGAGHEVSAYCLGVLSGIRSREHKAHCLLLPLVGRHRLEFVAYAHVVVGREVERH